MHKAEAITNISPTIALTDRDRRRIFFAINRIMKKIQRGVAKDLFADLKEIRLVGSAVEEPDLARMHEFGAAGAVLNDRIVLVYQADTPLLFAGWIERMAHELAHYAVEQFWKPAPDYRAHGNNTVHFSKNTGEYKTYETAKWMGGSLLEFLRTWHLESIDFQHYDVQGLIADTWKIQKMIEAGEAPARAAHPYWGYST